MQISNIQENSRLLAQNFRRFLEDSDLSHLEPARPALVFYLLHGNLFFSHMIRSGKLGTFGNAYKAWLIEQECDESIVTSCLCACGALVAIGYTLTHYTDTGLSTKECERIERRCCEELFQEASPSACEAACLMTQTLRDFLQKNEETNIDNLKMTLFGIFCVMDYLVRNGDVSLKNAGFICEESKGAINKAQAALICTFVMQTTKAAMF